MCARRHFGLRVLTAVCCCAGWVGLIGAAAAVGQAHTVYNVGLDFLDAPRDIDELPQAQLVEGEWVFSTTYNPVQITSPTSFAVTDGGLVGWNEADVRSSLRFQVEEAYRLITASSGNQTLTVNFFLGPVPTTAVGRRLNVVIGSNEFSGNLYGWSQTGAFLNEEFNPNDNYAAAVFLNTIDSIGSEPGIEINTSSAALNNLAGTIAHEVAHLFGLEHEPAGDSEPYEIMALGSTGLDSAKRLTKRQFGSVSAGLLLNAVPTLNKADFNFDGDVDVFQLNGKGDAQVLSAHLGLTSGTSHAQGDANSDGDVDVFQVNGQGDAQILVANLGTDLASGTAMATYNRCSGEVIVHIGAGIGVAGFKVNDLNAAAAPLLGNMTAAQFDDTVLAYFDAGGLPEGTFNLGRVLPAGLDASEVVFGYTPIGADSLTVAVTVVPEPSTLVMFGMGVSGLLLRRRNG